MFRKNVDPRVAAVTTIVALVAIQGVYWRFLVYTPPLRGGPMGAPPGGPPPPELAFLGLETVSVENWIGDEAGYRDGKSWEARFCGPNALAFLPNGDLVVSDSRNHCLRRVTSAGAVSTLAGGAFAASGGSQLGPAAQAGMRFPSGVAAAPDGTIFFSDTGNQRICALKDGVVTLLAGGQAGSADGPGAAAEFNSPGPCALDRSGLLWVLDSGNRKLRSVTRTGVVASPNAIPPEIHGILGEILAPKPAPIWGTLDGRSAPESSQHLVRRVGAASWVGQTRVFGEVARNLILVQLPGREPFLAAGRITPGHETIGDTEGPGYGTSFATPAAILARPDGTVFIADYDSNRLRRMRLPPELLR